MHPCFNCFCDACRFNYPSEKENPTHFLRCLVCDKCSDRYPECSECDNVIDIQNAIKKIGKAKKELMSCSSYFGSGDYIGALKQIRKSCNIFEEVIGVPDYDVARLYIKFAVAIECILNNHNSSNFQ